jgi:Uma2 family endonuclease
MQLPSFSVRLTYRVILALPDDLLRHELIDGEHIVSPSPSALHQIVVRNLLVHLHVFLRQHPIGMVLQSPFEVVLSEHDLVVPDLIYLSAKRKKQYLHDKRLMGPPDLAVEVLSRSTRSRDKTRKLSLYERTGVREYWMIDPQKESMEMYRRAGDRLVQVTATPHTLITPLIPGLRIPLSALVE